MFCTLYNYMQKLTSTDCGKVGGVDEGEIYIFYSILFFVFCLEYEDFEECVCGGRVNCRYPYTNYRLHEY